MDRIAAFVGHSFLKKDNDVIKKFLEFLDHVKDMGVGFTWDHAEPAQTRVLSEKVLQKMRNKNLFIGICTPREKTIDAEKLKTNFLDRNYLRAHQVDF